MFKNNQKKEFPHSARYRIVNGKVEAGSTSSRTNNSPTMPTKFEQPVKLTSILSSPTDTRKAVTSNATQDLNKAENLSQLISYKLVSDVKKQQPPTETNGVNVYSIQPPQTTDTLDTLSTIEKCITQMEAKAIQQKNIQKFLELCKSIKPDAKTDNNNKDKSQTSVVPPSVVPPNQPLKSFNEVENLLKPGVSDMEAEYTETTFDRSAKTRSSTSGAERAAIKSKPLSRAVSDAQEHKPITERVATKPKPRLARNVSQVCFVSYFIKKNTRWQEMKNFVWW